MPPWPPWVTQHGIDAKIHLVEELYREMEEIHLDTLGKTEAFRWWFKNLDRVDYIIGNRDVHVVFVGIGTTKI